MQAKSIMSKTRYNIGLRITLLIIDSKEESSLMALISMEDKPHLLEQ